MPRDHRPMEQMLTLEQLRGLPEPQPFDGGVYFLWQGDELVYIGGASNILARSYYQANVNRFAGQHWSPAAVPIKHDRITALVMVTGRYREPSDAIRIADAEAEYIARYPTRFNEREAIRPVSEMLT